MKNLIRVLPVIALFLAGCDAVSERDCGVFDHPELALWQRDTGSATLTYMSDDGASRTFNRQNMVLNSAFSGTDGASNDEDVVCELTATVRMRAPDNSLAITTIYTQEEQLLLASSDEVLLVDYQIEAPVGTILQGGFPADISDNRVRINFNPAGVTYLLPAEDADEQSEQDDTLLTEVINGLVYADVIRINAPESVAAPAGSAPSQASDVIKQIVLARNVGIVAFTDGDDREFIRVSPE